MNTARRDHVEVRRADHLLHQSETWHQTRRLVAYLEAMDHHINTISDPQSAAAVREWHRWATNWTHGADPLANTIAVPIIPSHTWRADPAPPRMEPLLTWDHTFIR